MLGSTSHSNGFPLTGSATQSSSTLGGSTSTVAAAGSPFFGVGSSLFSHGPHFMVSTSGSTVFGKGTISNEHRGSRIAPYATTTEVEGASSEQPTGKLTSVSAIPIYGDKNHEELRWEDYQLGDKGGPCTSSTVSAVGSSSIPGFESSSRPPFEASSTRAFTFGSTSSKPPFEDFSTRGSSFDSTSLFGPPASFSFGSTSCAASTVSAVGSSSIPGFESSSRPPFEASSTRGFSFGSTSCAASTVSAVGSSSIPGFESSSRPPFEASSTRGFSFGSTSCAASTVSAVGSSSIPGFESSSRPPFEASSTRAFTFGSTSLFGQPTSKFDVNAVGTTFPYGTQSSLFGPQITASPFGCVGFGKLASSDQSGGSRIAAYAATVEVEGTNSEQPAGKLMSISAISTYRNKSHEELRWEDYQLGDKGGSSPSCMPNFGSAGPYGASSVSAFGSSSMLACGPSSTPTFRFGPIPSYGQSSNAFIGSSGGTNPSSYGTGHSDFGSRTVESTFGSTGFVNPAFNDQHGGSRITPYTATVEVDELICNQSVGKFQSISAIPIYRNKSHEELRWEDYQLGDKGGPCPASQSVGTRSFGASMTKSSLLGPPTFCLSAINPSSSSTSSNSPKTSAFAASVGPSLIPPCSSSTFSASYTTIPFWTVSSTSAIPSAFEAASHPKFETSTSPPLVGASSSSSSSASRSSSSIISHASAPGTAPTFTSGLNYYSTQSSPWFLSEPSLGQTNATIGQSASTLGQGTAPSLGQSNISLGQNLFLSTPPLHPTSKESSLTSPHPEQAAQTDGNSNTNFGQTSAGVTNVLGQGTFDQLSTTQGAAVVPSQSLLPRENPRELIVGPTEQWPTRSEVSLSLLKDPSTSVHNKENAGVSIVDKKQSSPFKPEDRTDGVDLDVDSTQKRDADTPFPGHKDDEARTRTAHDVELLMPKLHHTDYYTEPTIQELAAKERGEAGFCCHVKDFLVGRHGYGCIKFSGETDVRGLELESLVQFNNREVILYMGESKKPPAGEGLDKAAEVTLFNIKCVDKRTGNQYMDGPRVNNYRNMLMKAAKNQGAEHVSYDPVKGEWKFRLQHFSKYLLSDEEEKSGRK